jgi:hypothetical protein
VPQALPVQETLQLTPFPDESPLTVADTGLLCAACTVAAAGLTITTMGGAEEPPLHPKLPIVSSTLSRRGHQGMRLSDFLPLSQMGIVCRTSTFFSDMAERPHSLRASYCVSGTHVLMTA